MNRRTDYLHSNLMTLATQLAKRHGHAPAAEYAVCEIAQTRTASQYPSDMAQAVTQFADDWGRVGFGR